MRSYLTCRWPHFGGGCGLMAVFCDRSRCLKMGFACRRRAKVPSSRSPKEVEGVGRNSRRGHFRALHEQFCARRGLVKRAGERTFAMIIRSATMLNSRSTRSTRQTGRSGSRGGSAFQWPVLGSAFGPAIHDQTAQIVRMAPMIASEMVIEMSSQCTASILKAMNASIAPKP
jgi:hypothetical protein